MFLIKLIIFRRIPTDNESKKTNKENIKSIKMNMIALCMQIFVLKSITCVEATVEN